MTNSHQLEDVAADNESSLKALVRAIRLSQGQFRLILARCNYGALRDHMVQRLRELSSVKIRELNLPASVKTLYTILLAELGDEKPSAVMVFGLESVNDLNTVLTSTNQVREEFRQNFPFPLVLWVNDQVLQKLIRLAPDFESWATSVEFALCTDELIDFLKQNTDALFTGNVITNLETCCEMEAAFQDLQSRGQELEPEAEAGLEFCRGLDDYANNQINAAIEHYQKSLRYWQERKHLERQSRLLLNIALCYYSKAEQNQRYWEQIRYYLQQCLDIFEQAERPDLVASHISKLGDALRQLQAWEDLQILAQKAVNLHQKYGNLSQLAQDYGFFAEVALEQSRWDDANQLAQQALQTLDRIPSIQPYKRGLYRFILARAQSHLGLAKEAVVNLEKAREEAIPQYNPKLHVDILEELQLLYYQEGEYLKAFELKGEKISTEFQYNFRAFAGTSHLQPKQQVIHPLLQTGHEAIISQEIAASGREQDVKHLIERISSNQHKLIVIHGQSGVGKSSILRAGLVPVLKQQPIGVRNALPVLVRFYTDWVGALGKDLAEGLEEKAIAQRHEDPPQPPLTGGGQEELISPPFQALLREALNSTTAVIKQLRKNADCNLLTVLIFDQFEEFFFVYREQAKRLDFYNFLQACLDIPYVKIILALREDYLHYLLECNRIYQMGAVNNILDKNILYYLGDFSPNEAKLVIENLTKRSQFYLEPALIEALVKDLAGELKAVRPIELQIVGAQLQSEKITTLEQYRCLGDNPKVELVERHLAEVIQDCGSEENRKLAQLVLYLLTDENNTRPLKTRAALAQSLELKADNLALVLGILVSSGLVVRVPESPADRYQMVHDYLVAFIRQQQGAELLGELRKEKEQRIRSEEKLKEFQIGQIDALSRYSGALFFSNKEFDALIEGLRAGIALKQAGGAKTDTEIQVVTALRQAVYGVRERNRLEGHSAAVISISYSPDGKTLASASEDNTIKLWNLATSEFIATLQGHSAAVISISYSPDGKTLASASEDKTIKLWNWETGKAIATLQGHSAAVFSISYSPDGKTLASASYDNTIKLWNRETGKAIATLQGHSAAVRSVSYSPDGKILASASYDNTIKLWNRETGKAIATLQGHRDSVWSVSYSPDGKTLASASYDNTIKLWNLATSEFIATLQGHSAAVFSVSYSPDGKILASASRDNTIKLWNRETGKAIATLQGHRDSVISISHSPDGKTLASASYDNTIKLWNRETGKAIATLQGHRDSVWSVSYNPDGKTLASASEDNTIKLWNRETGKAIATLQGHMAAVFSISYSPDGKTLASASEDKTIKLWNRETGKAIATLQGHSAAVFSVSYSPDGKTLASASEDKTIKLWNRETGKAIATFQGHMAAVFSVSYSPDGKILASASYDNTIKLWNRETGKAIATLQGHIAAVRSVSYSPDGKTLASASYDNTIKLWNRETGKAIATLQGHSAAVFSVSYSPDGKTLASASWDKTIKLWNLDLDDLLVRGCDWVHDYLQTNRNVSDRHLCDGIGTQK
ncbi:AAA family ATPase [Coleofasciculus sp. FACHB-SPT9]|uniref:WD40 domain-containing protein n=1 Tax=Cyanophyceae TaxID=3028117 RepID=UPI001685DFAF|nr:AAA family ATPase [Coleofasciculus sp. FACHB-SPT9]MBD1890761.1 AAA family ATPase [Coleofasciculus sp. FACHB-SPT9]